MNIFESLENLNVSEECFDEIVGLVEEIINELKAPTPETAKAVLDRKAQKLEDNTNKFREYGKLLNQPLHKVINKNKKVSDIPSLAREQREHEASLHQEKRSLNKGGERLYNWARKKGEQGKLTKDVADSALNMAKKGTENRKATAGF